MHVLDRHGRFFRVRGPLNVAGMPQGQIRELYLRSGITGSARIGTPSDIADAMQEWFEASAFDGFNVTPATLPRGGEDFIAMVVPELQRAAGSSVLNMREGPPAKTLA
jgi:alkanesulfonate monooxygenase SsuD/methylene tetrahydromethanopterin reductase-like flavin-dependent oxidoreductase (luciferase family)